MELRHLHYFATIAATGGFGRAARMLHVSQSAISEQMRDLEDEVGVQLIDRSQRQIRLTTEGEVFLTGAQKTLQSASQAVQAVQQSARGEIGHLNIGFFVGGNGTFFPNLIREFRRRFKGVQVTLVEMTPVRQVEALVRGDLHVGFTRPQPGAGQGQLRFEPLYTEPLYAVLPRWHAMAKQKEVSLKSLQNERFVIVDRASSLMVFDKVIALCTEAGFSPQISATASASSGVLALVEAGEGVAVIPEGSRFLASKEIVFVPLAGKGATVDLVIGWSPETENAAVKAFLTTAREFRGKMRR